MAENRWNNDDFEGEPFEFDGHPYLFEPEYTDEELRERDERAARERQRAADATTDLAPRESGGVPATVVRFCQQKMSVDVAGNGTFWGMKLRKLVWH